MSQVQTLALTGNQDLQAQLEALRAENARLMAEMQAKPFKRGAVSIDTKGKCIMVARPKNAEGKSQWPFLGTPEEYAIIFANREAIEEAARLILAKRG